MQRKLCAMLGDAGAASGWLNRLRAKRIKITWMWYILPMKLLSRYVSREERNFVWKVIVGWI